MSADDICGIIITVTLCAGGLIWWIKQLDE